MKALSNLAISAQLGFEPWRAATGSCCTKFETACMLWSLSLAPIILRKLHCFISRSIFSENVWGMKFKFGEDIEQYLRDQQPSPVGRDFLALIPVWSFNPKQFGKRHFKRPMKAKINITNKLINILFNFIEIFRPRSNLNMQFSGLYSWPSRFHVNNY